MTRFTLPVSVLLLAGCSVFNQSTPTTGQKQAPAVSAAQTEERAATRDSTASRDDIKDTQGRLTRDGFYHGPVDGVWGPATESAMKAYQAKHDLPQSGKRDAATMDSFNSTTQPTDNNTPVNTPSTYERQP